MSPEQVQAIEWPKATIGGAEYTFRLSLAARSQLVAWGFTDPSASIPVVAYAAAMAGNFSNAGKWRSAGFTRWVDLADALDPSEEDALGEAVMLAIKKAYPAAETATAAGTTSQPS